MIDDGRIPIALIIGGDLLSALLRCSGLEIEMDLESSPVGQIRRLGLLRGLPVYLDENLPPGKVLVTYKQRVQDTPWIRRSQSSYRHSRRGDDDSK